MKWTWLTATLALLGGLVAAPAALADGGPVEPTQGNAIAAPGSPYSYTAFGAGRDTVVKQSGGGAASELRVPGRFGIPAVDYSGTTTGLSADGRTLILAELPRRSPSAA